MTNTTIIYLHFIHFLSSVTQISSFYSQSEGKVAHGTAHHGLGLGNKPAPLSDSLKQFMSVCQSLEKCVTKRFTSSTDRLLFQFSKKLSYRLQSFFVVFEVDSPINEPLNSPHTLSQIHNKQGKRPENGGELKSQISSRGFRE